MTCRLLFGILSQDCNEHALGEWTDISWARWDVGLSGVNSWRCNRYKNNEDIAFKVGAAVKTIFARRGV